MAAVIECNRFTTATVRQATFSWSIEWNDSMKRNLSLAWPYKWAAHRWQGKMRRTSYQAAIAAFQITSKLLCANFCQSKPKTSDYSCIECVPFRCVFALLQWENECFAAHSHCIRIFVFFLFCWCAAYFQTDVMPRFEKCMHFNGKELNKIKTNRHDGDNLANNHEQQHCNSCGLT